MNSANAYTKPKEGSMKKLLLVLLLPLLAQAQNFHEIDPGKYYRSAQLSKAEFKKYIEQYGIRTVINLRGAEPKEKWYKDEMAITKELGVEHYDIAMDAFTIPTRENLIQLLDLYQEVPRPILLHCKKGKDRTGEASAVYVQEYMGASKKESLQMLTKKYNYTRWIAPAKHYFIDDVYKGEQWAREEYDPCKQQYSYEGKKACPKKVKSVMELSSFGIDF